MASKFYLSRILGRPVYMARENRVVGRISDLYVDTGFDRPKVVALKLRGGVTLDISSIDIVKDGPQYAFFCNSLRDKDVTGADKVLSLAETMLDKQIVDLDGHKVVRVNDLRLAVVSTGIFLIAVDVGLEGLLRRLGVAKQLKALLKPLHKSIPSRLILWDDVQTVEAGDNGLKLAAQAEKISMLHPSDVADIIEDLDKDTQASVFAALDEEKAADVLEEMEPEAQANMIDSLSIAKAADVLEKMPSDEVADILDVLDEHVVEELLTAMDKETSEEVRELMEYPENTVGSLMSTDFITVNEDMTVSDAFKLLQKEKPEMDTVFYLYVVSESGRLTGTVSLRDLAVADPADKLEDIMDEDYQTVHDDDILSDLTDVISKYNLPAVAVVDDDRVLLGTVIVSDVLYHMLHRR
ncbi:magnesium transporter [Ethanoligenens harbinense]|nr:magnesium transporter [Ethanoligenens harbinense YUAN-3]AYF40055.1 magnesium transporter [Ethanoligenens harbinense]AYF42888.1 magnesium transporter [Ethanoligenens harbinense]QCN93651.1 magnesium transporter [Ethanoligenens harbinense]